MTVQATGSISNVIMFVYPTDIGKIPYKADAGPEDTLVFKHYNATEASIFILRGNTRVTLYTICIM